MNVEIDCLFDFEGDVRELDGLLEDLADTFVKHGYGSDPTDENGPCRSLLILRNSPLVNAASEEDFIRKLLDPQDAVSITMPMEKEEASV